MDWKGIRKQRTAERSEKTYLTEMGRLLSGVLLQGVAEPSDVVCRVEERQTTSSVLHVDGVPTAKLPPRRGGKGRRAFRTLLPPFSLGDGRDLRLKRVLALESSTLLRHL